MCLGSINNFLYILHIPWIFSFFFMDLWYELPTAEKLIVSYLQPIQFKCIHSVITYELVCFWLIYCHLQIISLIIFCWSLTLSTLHALWTDSFIFFTLPWSCIWICSFSVMIARAHDPAYGLVVIWYRCLNITMLFSCISNEFLCRTKLWMLMAQKWSSRSAFPFFSLTAVPSWIFIEFISSCVCINERKTH